jgi:hypothetical protein
MRVGMGPLHGRDLVLVLHFVPEPGLLLLGSGVAGLATLGRRRIGSIRD